MPLNQVTYIALMLLSLGVCAGMLRRSQQSLRLRASQKLGIGIGAYCGAMIGAKLPYVLADWDGLLSGVAWFSHGKTILCGIVGGYMGVELTKWILGVRIKTGDSFAVPVATAVAIGRVACFHAGCCYGRPTDLPWGVRFPEVAEGSPLPRHPTQLYEAAFHATMAVVLAWLGRRDLLRHQRLKLYLLSYLGFRFLSEWLRPEPVVGAGLTGYQWGAAVLMAVFLGLWWRDSARGSLPVGAAAAGESACEDEGPPNPSGGATGR